MMSDSVTEATYIYNNVYGLLFYCVNMALFLIFIA